jgi:hypothetical protein
MLSSIDARYFDISVQKKKDEIKYTIMSYSLISVTLLVFSSVLYFPSSIVLAMPSSCNSGQQANSKTTNAELASIGDRNYSSPQRHGVEVPSLTNTFATYENPAYGIAIQYPYNWEKIEYPRIGLATVGSDLIVNFEAPVVNASDHWREHLLIQVLKQTQAKKLIPQSETTLGGMHGYKRVDNSTMEISNLDTNTQTKLDLKTMDVWTTNSNGNTYLLTYKAVNSRYSYYLPTIQKMLDSFKIIDNCVNQ